VPGTSGPYLDVVALICHPEWRGGPRNPVYFRHPLKSTSGCK
jgi:hypothetical protein